MTRLPLGMSTAAGTPRGIRADIAARALVGLVTLGLLAMVGRVVQLQVAPSQRLTEQETPRVATVKVSGSRGEFLDRRGRPLATSRSGYRIFIDPEEFPENPDEPISQLAGALAVPASALGDHILTAISTNKERKAALAPYIVEDESPLTKWAGHYFGKIKATDPKAPAPTPRHQEVTIHDTAGDSELDDPGPPPLIRYLKITEVVDDKIVDAVKALHIKGVHLEQRPVREYPGGAVVAPIIGRLGGGGTIAKPQSGVEQTHDRDLKGEIGRVSFTRDKAGRPLWMDTDSFQPAMEGKSLRLSIDLEIQRLAAEELVKAVYEADAAGGRLVVMDVATGEILAMLDVIRPVPEAVPFPWADAPPKGPNGRKSDLLYEPPPVLPHQRYITVFPDPLRSIDPAMARNRCVQDVYEPGSTFKPFVWATVTQLGAQHENDDVDVENGRWASPYRRTIGDVHKKSHLTWAGVLIQSSNIGMSKGALKIGFEPLRNAVLRFGFGSKTNLGLPFEAGGRVTNKKNWSFWTQMSVSFGQEIAVTPVQMVRAFCIFCRSGDLAGTLPPARLVAVDPNERQEVLHRVVKPEVAMLPRNTLREVAATMEAKLAETDKSETGWRYAILGKSGTAQIAIGSPPKGKVKPPGFSGFLETQVNSSFIAAGPTEHPRLACLVIIEDPGPELRRKREHYGTQVAGPVVRRILEKSLTYLGVPPSPPQTGVGTSAPAAD